MSASLAKRGRIARTGCRLDQYGWACLVGVERDHGGFRLEVDFRIDYTRHFLQGFSDGDRTEAAGHVPHVENDRLGLPASAANGTATKAEMNSLRTMLSC